MSSYFIIAASGVKITTDNIDIAKSFAYDGAKVFDEFDTPMFSGPSPVYPVWLSEIEKDQIIANWEKTGMFSSIVEKIRSAEMTKGIR